MSETIEDILEELEPNEQRPLTLKQEEFCKIYATDPKCMGNGTRAYEKVYGAKTTSSQSLSSRLLGNVIICEKINSYLEKAGFNDVFMDKQLLFIASQYSELGPKLRAVETYYKVTKRIDESTKVENNTFVVDGGKIKQLKELKERLRK